MEGTGLKISTSPFPFLHVVEQLKQTIRRGWEIRNIDSPESVSDHMYRMAIMIMMAPGTDDETRTHAVKMALVHDLGEALIGDIVPSDNISKQEKYLRECLALQYLSCLVRDVNPAFAGEIMGLWREFEDGTSKPARLVRSMDALECMDQAVIYEERSRRTRDLSEFMQLESRITVPELENWVVHLKQEREAIWSGGKGMFILFVIGGPGVGKGTQCARLARDFGGVHISVGDLLRDEAKSHTSPYTDFINESIRNSVTIPADLTIRLLKKKISEAQVEGPRVFIVDGFPRNLDQAHAFEEKIHDSNCTILLDCPEMIMIERLHRRSKSSGRVDDNTESMLRRLQVFANENAQVEDHLRKTGRLWKIEAAGTVEEVYSSLKLVVDKIVDH